MSYSVLNLKQDLIGVLHGTTLNQVQNLDGLINRAARQVLQDVDPMETQRIAQFTTPVFEQAYTYAINEDVKGNKIIDIRPIVNRTGSQIFNQDYSQQFNLSKTLSLGNQFNIQWNTGIRTLNVNSYLSTAPIVINQSAGTTLNGTWAVGGGATALTTNNVNYLVGGGAIQFNLSAGSPTGYVECTGMDSVDLTEHLNQATEFLWTYLPLGSAVTAIEYRWGSSSTNYYARSVSVTQANTTFQNGYNQLAYQWSGITPVGSPDVSDITYLRVTYTYDQTLQTGVLLNDITSQLGQIMEYVYYSKYLFRSSVTGAFQETVLDDADLINLDTDSYNLLFDQVALMTGQQVQGQDALQYDAQFFANKYNTDLTSYRAKYKSEVQKPKVTYYGFPQSGYTPYLTRRWA